MYVNDVQCCIFVEIAYAAVTVDVVIVVDNDVLAVHDVTVAVNDVGLLLIMLLLPMMLSMMQLWALLLMPMILLLF